MNSDFRPFAVEEVVEVPDVALFPRSLVIIGTVVIHYLVVNGSDRAFF